MPTWVHVIFNTANFIFTLQQHSIYFSQYFWVTYLIPITFTDQTPKIKRKIKNYGTVIVTIAIAVVTLPISYSPTSSFKTDQIASI